MGPIRCNHVVIIVAACIAGCTGCSPTERKSTGGVSARDKPGQQNMADKQVKGFWARNLSLVQLNGSRVGLRLVAEKVVHRRRTTRLFVYENHDEIFLKGLRIDFPLAEAGMREKRMKLPLGETEEVLRSIAEPPTLAADAPIGSGETDDVLSRVVIEDVYIRILTSRNSPIDVHAKQAIIGGDFNVVLFERGMILSGSTCEIAARTALWDAEHEGFMFAAGYVKDHKKHNDKAFIAVEENGSCHKVTPVSDVNYIDPLEELEAEFLASISPKMPAFARFMLGIPISVTSEKRPVIPKETKRFRP